MIQIIRNATLINEGKIQVVDVLIRGQRIEKIAPLIQLPQAVNCVEIEASGLYLMPGVIDDQVHFRDPGLTHKGTIRTESMAAVAGGITSFMDMPNTIPNVLTQELLEDKYRIAANHSVANYSFFMGVSKDNLEEVLKTDNEKVCGITDDGLYFHKDDGILANYPDFLEQLFARTSTLFAIHSEDDAIIKQNYNNCKTKYKGVIPMSAHPEIRSELACLTATKRVIDIAQKHQVRLHFFHISTAAEANLFRSDIELRKKRITAEACVHHLWFSATDYATLGAKLKWNPAVKSASDKEGLLAALIQGKLDIIATDHAPHLWAEKSGDYESAMSGGPLVQHALPAMLELVLQDKLKITQLVEKMCHNVAEIYRLKDRGYVREGYYADLVLFDLQNKWQVDNANILYKCKWSPFEGQQFKAKVLQTFVNGHCMYNHTKPVEAKIGMRLLFDKDR